MPPLNNDIFSATVFAFSSKRFGEIPCSEIILPSVERDVIEYLGGNFANAIKMPGRIKVGHLTIKNCLNSNMALYDWVKDNLEKGPCREDLTISLFNSDRSQRQDWLLIACWACKYQLAPLNALNPNPLIQTLECACEDVRLINTK